MTEYRPDVRCPNCRRAPNVSFSEDQVAMARRARQAEHVVNVQCPRCRTRYWIKARDIARSASDAPAALPENFPERDALVAAGVLTVSQLLQVQELTSLPGIGPARAKRIILKLDTMRAQAVA